MPQAMAILHNTMLRITMLRIAHSFDAPIPAVRMAGAEDRQPSRVAFFEWPCDGTPFRVIA
ncbi:hypothetical protein [Azospirillum brasilense]|uniref:hypothetical protein n=2 Tax=Azospirillum brasilense TaxID=192 RepID=UPI003CE4A20F